MRSTWNYLTGYTYTVTVMMTFQLTSRMMLCTPVTVIMALLIQLIPIMTIISKKFMFYVSHLSNCTFFSILLSLN